MGSLGELFVTVGAKIDGFERDMGTVSQRLSAIDRDATRASAGFEKMGTRLTTIGGAMTAGITLPMIGIGAAVVTVAGQMEQTEIAFKTMLGSGESATAMLNELKAFAATSPFEFPELALAAKKMMAMGFAAEDVIPTLRIIGDAAAALGMGTEGIDRITLALSQMRNAGRVMAQDMNQLTSAGVRGWQYLAEAAGVSVAEIRKQSESGMLDGATAAQAILAGMQRDFGGAMDAQSKTLLGQWSNIKDLITFALMDLGKILLPIAKDVLAAMKPVIESVKDLAAWFSTLDPNVRTAVLAFGGIVTVLGPIIWAVGTLVGSVSTIAAAFTSLSGVVLPALGTAMAGVSLPILAVVAALAALGVWVYANWEPIKAVVTQAWDGLTEAWGYVWSEIGPTLTAIWTGISDVASTVWNGLVTYLGAIWSPVFAAFDLGWSAVSATLSAIWDGLKFAANMSFGAIANAVELFLAAVGKIPGVSKLLNLDETWTKVKAGTEAFTGNTEALGKNEAATKKAGVEGKKLNLVQTSSATAATAAKDAQKALEKATDEQRKATVKSRTAHLQMDVTWQTVIARANAMGGNVRTLTADIVRLRLEVEKNPTKLDDITASFDDLVTSMDEMAPTIGDITRALPPLTGAISASMATNTTSADNFGAALGRLGVKSTTEYDSIAADAKATYEAIAGSGIATTWETDNAMLRMMQAQRDAMVANGQAIPADFDAMLGKLESSASLKGTSVTDKFATMKTNISGIIQNLGADMVHSLFEGEGSWAEKGINALKSLGEAVLMHFVDPAMAAIGDFIANTIADLLSGRGLGGVLDSIKEIGKSLASVFGIADSAASTVSGAAGAAGSAAGAAGSAGSGAGSAAAAAGNSVSAVVSAVAGVVTAVSGIISNFQQMGMNKSLDLIVKHTLQLVGIGEATFDGVTLRMDEIQDRLQEFRKIGIKVWTDDTSLSFDTEANTMLSDGLAAIVASIEALGVGVSEWLEAAFGRLGEIHNRLVEFGAYGLKTIADGSASSAPILPDARAFKDAEDGLGGILSALKEISKVSKEIVPVTAPSGGSSVGDGAVLAALTGIGSTATVIATTLKGFRFGALESMAKDVDRIRTMGESLASMLATKIGEIQAQLLDLWADGLKVFSEGRAISLEPSIVKMVENGFIALVSAVKELGTGNGGGMTPQSIYVQVDGRTIATAMVGYIEQRTGRAV